MAAEGITIREYVFAVAFQFAVFMKKDAVAFKITLKHAGAILKPSL